MTVKPCAMDPAGSEQAESACGCAAARSTFYQLLAVSSCPHVQTSLVRASAAVPVSLKCDKTLSVYQHLAHQCLLVGITSLRNPTSHSFKTTSPEKKRLLCFHPTALRVSASFTGSEIFTPGKTQKLCLLWSRMSLAAQRRPRLFLCSVTTTGRSLCFLGRPRWPFIAQLCVGQLPSITFRGLQNILFSLSRIKV